MKKLYAVFIGINDYPNPHHQLNGCVEDLEAIHSFFKTYCETSEIDFSNVVVLKNAQATRQNIINSFDVFKDASSEDFCLFFYSGHGSSMYAPKEFFRDEINKTLETMVCYDSRLPGGKDLVDKELSYLLWKHTHKAQPHFLTIFDCCHSGSITRNADVTHRMAESNPNQAFLEQLEGYEHFKEQDGTLVPPSAKHITLSACREYQSSVEMRIEGKPRGLFTWALMKTLRNSPLNQISYQELLALVYAKTQNKYTAQHPRLDAYNGFNPKQLFLNGALKLKSNGFITYDKWNSWKGWKLSLGAIHGMRKDITLFCKTKEGTQKATIDRVETSVSFVKTMPWMKEGEHYEIEAFSALKPSFKISLEKVQKDKIKDRLTDIASEKELAIEWTENADYEVVLKKGALSLCRTNKEQPVFQAVSLGLAPKKRAENVALFLDNVMRVHQWNYVSELSNPRAKTPLHNEVELTFSEVLEHDAFKVITKTEEKDINAINDFTYREQFGQWKIPCLTLSVKNKGSRSLWIGGLFLSTEDYSVSSAYLPLMEVKPNDAPYEMFFEHDGYRYPMIPLNIPETLSQKGIDSLRNQIKLFISTEEFDLNNFEQSGLYLPGKKRSVNKKGAGFGTQKNPSYIKDWAVIDLNFNIVKPQLVESTVYTER